ncbi:MAG: hypothetical protein ACFFB3_01915 [Candidatus Hodarchaeota archaeon]
MEWKILSSCKSENSFQKMVERFVDFGIIEFPFTYPAFEKQLLVFEKIANDAISELRDQFNKWDRL